MTATRITLVRADSADITTAHYERIATIDVSPPAIQQSISIARNPTAYEYVSVGVTNTHNIINNVSLYHPDDRRQLADNAATIGFLNSEVRRLQRHNNTLSDVARTQNDIIASHEVTIDTLEGANNEARLLIAEKQEEINEQARVIEQQAKLIARLRALPAKVLRSRRPADITAITMSGTTVSSSSLSEIELSSSSTPSAKRHKP